MGRNVKVGIVGLGSRAQVLLHSFFSIEDVEIAAVCDLDEERVNKTVEMLLHAGRPAPRTFRNHRELLRMEELEAVFVLTSWNSHLPIAIDCMEAGKYAAIEIGGASNLDELWQLVRTYERTGMPCMMLENCCYARNELLVLNMVRQGLFGELVHCEGGYEHDLRERLTAPELTGDERAWHNRCRNAELYPSHSLGPIAKILRINRGNRFMSLTSTASRSCSIPARRRELAAQGLLDADVSFQQGDVITTVIKCAGGQTITLTHSVSLPRPYTRNARVQGTRGIWLEDAGGIYIEGLSREEVYTEPTGHSSRRSYWDPVEDYYEQYDHPIWKEQRRLSSGHRDADVLMLRAFLDAVRQRIDTPIDVYDTAAWMAVTCLSEQSIATGSMPAAFPDFTGGRWVCREAAPESRWSLDEVYERDKV